MFRVKKDMKIAVGPTDALIVVDVQNDFVPNGALAVPRGDEVVSIINVLALRFANVILTKDWHPEGHVSFTSSGGPWPAHCVQGTKGAELHSDLSIPHALFTLQKGGRPDFDSYSAFNEADGKSTGLAEQLRERGIRRVFICGLATDYCVAWSAKDARKAGFGTVVVEDACRAIDINGSLTKAWEEMDAVQVGRILASAITS